MGRRGCLMRALYSTEVLRSVTAVLDACVVFDRGVEVSDCGRYLVAVIHEGCEPVNRFYYCDLHALPDGVTGQPFFARNSSSLNVGVSPI